MTILAMVGMPLHAQQAKPYRIVFWVEDDIFTINADGSGLLHLEYNPGFGSVAWSPDGSQIAVTSNTTGNFQIYTMNPDGSNLQSLKRQMAFYSLPIPRTASGSPTGTNATSGSCTRTAAARAR
jgi:hypothetical protein